MIREELLNKELAEYKRRGLNLSPKKFNKNEFYNLFKKYRYYGMTENSYCCYGEECCCWQELTEEGIHDLSLKEVKTYMTDVIKNIKHVLRCKKDGNRFYIYKNKTNCFIYVYARDTIHKTDFKIWFCSEEYTNL